MDSDDQQMTQAQNTSIGSRLASTEVSKKESPIMGSLRDLDMVIEDLARNCQQLQDRLFTVLSPETPDKDSQPQDSVEPRSLAEQIHVRTNIVRRISRLVGVTSKRLEL